MADYSAAVTVYSAKGDVIATGHLGNSKSPNYDTCVFDVAVPDVPKGEKFYKVEVSHRGTVQMSAKEAEAGEFGASLGSRAPAEDCHPAPVRGAEECFIRAVGKTPDDEQRQAEYRAGSGERG
ncbi:hypothetical protein [Streptomyces sp. NPDC005251]|uniref:hypothetical protein n=1 Tax=unclassified Streptomyces TaxID=2593676 RepID=UPI0033AA8EC0